jgi:Ca2+-binding EF-hand superfamily protein
LAVHGGVVHWQTDELRAAMKALRQPMSRTEAEALMLELDSGGDGTIEFSEFVEFIKPKILSQDLEKDIRSLFVEFADEPLRDEEGNVMLNKFDEEIPGFITTAGLQRVGESVGEMMNDEELDEIIEYVTDGDTRIDEATVRVALPSSRPIVCCPQRPRLAPALADTALSEEQRAHICSSSRCVERCASSECRRPGERPGLEGGWAFSVKRFAKALFPCSSAALRHACSSGASRSAASWGSLMRTNHGGSTR